MPSDVNELAAAITEKVTEEPSRLENKVREVMKMLGTGESPPRIVPPQPEKDPAAVALGRKGGLKGGRARAEALTPEQRAEIAKAAAAARWKKK